MVDLFWLAYAYSHPTKRQFQRLPTSACMHGWLQWQHVAWLSVNYGGISQFLAVTKICMPPPYFAPGKVRVRLNRSVLELSGAYEWNFSPNDARVNTVLSGFQLQLGFSVGCLPKMAKTHCKYYMCF